MFGRLSQVFTKLKLKVMKRSEGVTMDNIIQYSFCKDKKDLMQLPTNRPGSVCAKTRKKQTCHLKFQLHMYISTMMLPIKKQKRERKSETRFQ
jgi:hypothetical protein